MLWWIARPRHFKSVRRGNVTYTRSTHPGLAVVLLSVALLGLVALVETFWWQSLVIGAVVLIVLALLAAHFRHA